MDVRPARRTLAAAVTAASAALLLAAVGPAASPVTSAADVTGPLPAGAALHGEHEELNALPPADIADRDSVGDQLKYAKQAAALPVAEPGRAWKNVGPYGQDDPA